MPESTATAPSAPAAAATSGDAPADSTSAAIAARPAPGVSGAGATAPRGRGRRRGAGSDVLDCLLLTLTCVAVILFIVYPLACMVGQSLRGGAQASLSLYAQVVTGAAGLIWNSAFTGALTSLLATALSLLIALCVVFAPRWIRRVLTAFLLVSVVSPPFVTSLAYIELFGRRGLITHGLLGLSVMPYGWVGVVLMQALFFTAINVVLIVSVLDRLDRRMLQAAMDLGAPMRAVFARVILPMLAPTLAVCLLLTFVRSVADYGTPVVIGGSFETISTEIYMQVIGYSDLESAAVLNVLLLGVSVVVFAAYVRLTRRSDRLVAGSAGAGSLARDGAPAGRGADSGTAGAGEAGFRLRGVLGALSYAAGGLFACLMALLYFTVFHTALTKGLGWDAPLTTEYVRHLFDYDWDSFVRSVEYALAAAAGGTAIGAVVAYYVQRRHVRGGKLLELAVTLPYMLPGTCFGLGYILAFNSVPLKLTGTAAIVVLSMVFKQLTISTRAFSTTMAQVSPTLDMAARDLGASRLRTLTDVILPNVRNAFVVSFVNSFSTSMVTYSAVIFLVTPGHKTAVFQLFDALSTGKYGQAAAVACLIVIVTVLVNLAFSSFLLKGRR